MLSIVGISTNSVHDEGYFILKPHRDSFRRNNRDTKSEILLILPLFYRSVLNTKSTPKPSDRSYIRSIVNLVQITNY